MSRELAILSVMAIVDETYGSTGYAIEGSSPAPRPVKTPYASVDILTSLSVNGHSVRVIPSGNEFAEEVAQLIECVVSVNFYRDGAGSMAEKFITMLSTNFAVQTMSDASMGITRTSGIRNLDTVVRGKTERRAQVDVFLNYPSIVSSPIDVIENVDISGELI